NWVAQCLVELRRALADDSQQWIRTVARRGYVFTAPVTAPVAEFPRRAGGGRIDPDPSPVPPVAETPRHLSHWILAGVAALLALAAGGLVLMRLNRPAAPARVADPQ